MYSRLPSSQVTQAAMYQEFSPIVEWQMLLALSNYFFAPDLAVFATLFVFYDSWPLRRQHQQ